MNNNVSVSSFIKSLNEKIVALENMVNEMGLDVQASRKNRFRRKTQSNALNNMSRALCVGTMDPYLEGRVKFYHPILHEPDTPVNSLPYAKSISTMGGFDDCGLVWVPPAGSTICLVFENGDRGQAYYLGTTTQRNRGPNGSKLGFPVPEYDAIYKGHRGGYIAGDNNDESQSLPQWTKENYNTNDYNSQTDFSLAIEEQKKFTYPNIYGFKTPEKHMCKLVDGNAKCDRRGKRMEWLSGCGNAMIFKDDHIHYAGQFAHPSCGANPGGDDIGPCSIHQGDQPFFTDPTGQPIEAELKCGSSCDSDGRVSCGKIQGGHPSTPLNPNVQTGSNKNFKHENECRPYKGPQTPQNNRYNLPQSGIQILSISGQSFLMDDSVEEPRGIPEWERSTKPFDFGCSDKFLGRIEIKSATGHSFLMNDVEEDTGLRAKDNGIRLLSALGNEIRISDHTVGEGGCKECPPNIAGEERGIHIRSTSNHQLNFIDNMNEQCGPCRKEGGVPKAKATHASVQLISGFGSELRFSDDNSQEKTQNQWIQLTNPQCVSASSDPSCNIKRGPHFLRFQGRPQGEPGIIFLRAGGHSIRSTYDMDIVLVGDKEENPSDKFTYVSKMQISATEDIDFRYTGEMHVLFAEKYILLMAGRDCPPKSGKCCGPCLYPVIVGRCPQICPLTGWTHWTEKAMSTRVFASSKNDSDCGGPFDPGGPGLCPPGGQPFPCTEDQNQGQGVNKNNQGGNQNG